MLTAMPVCVRPPIAEQETQGVRVHRNRLRHEFDRSAEKRQLETALTEHAKLP